MAQFSNEEIKIISISGPIWVRMLRERETRILGKMYADLRNGKTDFLALVTEYAVVREQITEIITVLKTNNVASD